MSGEREGLEGRTSSLESGETRFLAINYGPKSVPMNEFSVVIELFLQKVVILGIDRTFRLLLLVRRDFVIGLDLQKHIF